MPYIIEQDRPPLDEHIKVVIAIIAKNPDLIGRMEMAGFYAHEVIREYVGKVKPYEHTTLNCMKFDKKDRYDIVKAAEASVKRIMRPNTDLLSHAGEINYCISAVGWGAMGAWNNFLTSDITPPSAKYAQRAYWRATISYVRDEMKSTGDIRTYLMLRGVLDDVVDEAYRRQTAAYEDLKMKENGDVSPFSFTRITSCDHSSSPPEAESAS